jgi:hypothetical protein
MFVLMMNSVADRRSTFYTLVNYIARFAIISNTISNMSSEVGDNFEDAAVWLSSTPAAANLSNDTKLEVSWTIPLSFMRKEAGLK